MRILVTGSSGQLGSALVRRLTADNEIVGLDVVPSETTSHVGSVDDRQLVFDAVKGADAVIHVASLHAPHVGEFSKGQFVDVNVHGTLNLLEASVESGVRRFVYTSTTSVYGLSMIPKDKAVWVTEELTPKPRDIYDVTKLAAEQLCEHFASAEHLPAICLRVARFWNEPPELKAIYRLYRGVDVRDVVDAHLLALQNTDVESGIFNISAKSPFQESDLAELLVDPASVIRRYHPKAEGVFARQGWKLPTSIDRVYVTERATRELGYAPKRSFGEVIQELRK
jgi:nucleoside-diphosphate-sugar epimerase